MKRPYWILLILLLASGAASALDADAPKVEIFVTGWCPYCSKLESFLKKKKISYKRYDIERDEKGAEIFSSIGGEGVPVSRVNGRTVVPGYDPDAILAALND